MKNMTWAVVVLILAALFILEFRYALVINSPIVAKIDRITGDVWIANSGMWLKVQHSVKDKTRPEGVAQTAKPVGKTSEGKAK